MNCSFCKVRIFDTDPYYTWDKIDIFCSLLCAAKIRNPIEDLLKEDDSE